ncbi:DUF1684 domain-containing protein [Marinilongibacter aquaticus]|uniref:DUF1684 domain-containing protein n=1 Tax=Marinilongibacter aquaticus TaxID=2975157 RepID=UPI0021BD6F13|nr:DUF1684 domain-containing protein [Marinilongibacter aquaticus]UBM58887.1 DUF1684 domain-containing protein [Marinilongibacter aquaticus]
MFKSKAFKWGIALVFLVAAIYSLTMNQGSFADRVAAEREKYLSNLESMENSPIAKIENFEDFNYYPADEKYVINADFEEVISDETFAMMMTDGSREEIATAGTATFELNGEPQKVTLFDEGETLLLPFRDQSNGKETYGGGRYINIKKTNNNRVTIDFNEAHNFYCVYNELFVCPVPPQSNTLTVAVEAGEKVLKKIN